MKLAGGTGLASSMLCPGVQVFTGNCQEGTVVASQPFRDDRLYEVSIGEEVHKFGVR